MARPVEAIADCSNRCPTATQESSRRNGNLRRTSGRPGSHSRHRSRSRPWLRIAMRWRLGLNMKLIRTIVVADGTFSLLSGQAGCWCSRPRRSRGCPRDGNPATGRGRACTGLPRPASLPPWEFPRPVSLRLDRRRGRRLVAGRGRGHRRSGRGRSWIGDGIASGVVRLECHLLNRVRLLHRRRHGHLRMAVPANNAPTSDVAIAHRSVFIVRDLFLNGKWMFRQSASV